MVAEAQKDELEAAISIFIWLKISFPTNCEFCALIVTAVAPGLRQLRC